MKKMIQQIKELLHGVSNDSNTRQIIPPKEKQPINIQRTYDAYKGLEWNKRQELLWKEEIANK